MHLKAEGWNHSPFPYVMLHQDLEGYCAMIKKSLPVLHLHHFLPEKNLSWSTFPQIHMNLELKCSLKLKRAKTLILMKSSYWFQQGTEEPRLIQMQSLGFNPSSHGPVDNNGLVAKNPVHSSTSAPATCLFPGQETFPEDLTPSSSLSDVISEKNWRETIQD